MIFDKKDIKNIVITILGGIILIMIIGFFNFNSRLIIIETILKEKNTKIIQKELKEISTITDFRDYPEKDIIFKETFKSYANDWDNYDRPNAYKGINNNKYTISNIKSSLIRWSVIPRPRTSKNFNIYMKCKYIKGDNEGTFGVILKNSKDYKFFYATKRGQAGLNLYKNDRLVNSPIPKNDGFFNPNGDVFTIQIRGDYFTYYLNGIKVGVGYNNDLVWNEFGIFISGENTSVEFEKIIIYKI